MLRTKAGDFRVLVREEGRGSKSYTVDESQWGLSRPPTVHWVRNPGSRTFTTESRPSPSTPFLGRDLLLVRSRGEDSFRHGAGETQSSRGGW